MGRSHSAASLERDLELHYKYIRRYSNGCYGELTVIERRSNHKLYALKEFVSESNTLFDRLQARKALQHPHLLRLVDFWLKEEASLCSNLKQVYLLLDYEDSTLDEDIVQRQLENRPWQPHELLEMLKGLVDGLLFLQENGISHNNVSTKSVLISREGDARLLQPQLLSLYSSKSEYVLQTVGSAFQAPEVLLLSQGYLSEATYRKIDFGRATVFSIGLVALAICFLSDSIDEEVMSNGQYDFVQIKRLCRTAGEQFEHFAQLLPRMLKKEPQRRPDLNELQQILTIKLHRENASCNSQSFKELRQTRLAVDTKGFLDTKVLPSKKYF